MFSASVPECFRSRARVSNILTKSCLRDSYFSLSIASRVSENAVLSWIFIISLVLSTLSVINSQLNRRRESFSDTMGMNKLFANQTTKRKKA